MDADDYMTYEEFGRKFFETAVTEARVGGAISAIAGDVWRTWRSARWPLVSRSSLMTQSDGRCQSMSSSITTSSSF